jgi:hypothetical protein
MTRKPYILDIRKNMRSIHQAERSKSQSPQSKNDSNYSLESMHYNASMHSSSEHQFMDLNGFNQKDYLEPLPCDIKKIDSYVYLDTYQLKEKIESALKEMLCWIDPKNEYSIIDQTTDVHAFESQKENLIALCAAIKKKYEHYTKNYQTPSDAYRRLVFLTQRIQACAAQITPKINFFLIADLIACQDMLLKMKPILFIQNTSIKSSTANLFFFMEIAVFLLTLITLYLYKLKNV